jgi:hypothetical protein
MRWTIRVEKTISQSALFEGANIISRVCGCELDLSRNFLENLPGNFRLPLYKQQAQRLIRELKSVQVIAHLVVIKKIRTEILEVQYDSE